MIITSRPNALWPPPSGRNVISNAHKGGGSSDLACNNPRRDNGIMPAIVVHDKFLAHFGVHVCGVSAFFDVVVASTHTHTQSLIFCGEVRSQCFARVITRMGFHRSTDQHTLPGVKYKINIRYTHSFIVYDVLAKTHTLTRVVFHLNM